MKTTLQTWGNSQGVRIPKSYLATVGWQVGDDLEIDVNKGSIRITPSKMPIRGRYRIEDLVKKMPKKNKSEEISTGLPVGREVW